MTDGKFYLGLSLGRAGEYSALAVLERQPHEAVELPGFHCRHLQRWPLKTPYPEIVADVARTAGQVSKPYQRGKYQGEAGGMLMHALAESIVEQAARSILAVDSTGVGPPVVDLLRREQTAAELRVIQITGGDKVTHEGGITRAPKRDLVSTAQVALQSGRLKIAASLQEAQTLARELQNFRAEIRTDAQGDSFGAWREGAHDDLVLAVAVALWVASFDIPAPTCAPDGVTQRSPWTFY